MDVYEPQTIELRWQRTWRQTRIYEADLTGAQRPFYNLMMFPYPSAEGLHVGNVFAYTGADIYGRFTAMRGYDVFEPIGFDAFGIHSENFAIKRNTHPRELTARNVEYFREHQLERMGNRFDWSHGVTTTDPAYYRWTQWIFLQLFKAGLAVRKSAPVNWCPNDLTVLADEQVVNGCCERCATPVIQRTLEQWFLRSTAYADRLLDNLDHLDWSALVKTAQRRWIGRSRGVDVNFAVLGSTEPITTFTTHLETLFGVTFIALAPSHPRAAQLDGATAVNPVNGEHVPVLVADYVVAEYGSAAVMGVPAHDERDAVFAEQHGLPVRMVVDGDRLVDSGPFSGLSIAEGVERIAEWLVERGLGQRATRYRLRDWLISRQRYWGPPIPIVYCSGCGVVPVPESDLPVLLPETEHWRGHGTGSSPLAAIPEFVNTMCPQCGGPATRETDVSDNFLDSAWYFLRYPSAHFSDRAFDAELTKKWLPVDMYIGGAEHAVLHLLYSRFITMALHDLGLLEFEEPFTRFRAHGLLVLGGAKISKSRGNVVNPDDYIQRYGADALRLALMFIGPFEQSAEFSDRGVHGMHRFLGRVFRLVLAPPAAECDRTALHLLIQRVTEDVEVLHYNTAIAALMGYLNARSTLHAEEASVVLRLLAPFAPHLAEELWARLGQPFSVHQQPWPAYDPALVRPSTVAVAVQVNGRTRAIVQLAPDASESEALAAANVDHGNARRIIYRPGRVLNIVVDA